jgi:hypothetical protein
MTFKSMSIELGIRRLVVSGEGANDVLSGANPHTGISAVTKLFLEFMPTCGVKKQEDNI